ncbi:MAG: hypothetical protein KA714_30780 [Limnoraphis sp. WC205]|jgi:hypothetical protein|nr:hypothetical protein [Limnoraphis sp. WC205]
MTEDLQKWLLFIISAALISIGIALIAIGIVLIILIRAETYPNQTKSFALLFDGVDDYVQIQTNNTINKIGIRIKKVHNNFFPTANGNQMDIQFHH